MSRTTCLAAFALLLAACAPKSEDGAAAEGGYADSMAVVPVDSATATSDPAAMAGTVPASPAAVRDSATKSGAAAKSPEAMGRDSAFGPSFMVDSAGKLVPLPKKKP